MTAECVVVLCQICGGMYVCMPRPGWGRVVYSNLLIRQGSHVPDHRADAILSFSCSHAMSYTVSSAERKYEDHILQVRQLAAVLLRKRIRSHWRRIEPAARQQLQRTLQEKLIQEPAEPVRYCPVTLWVTHMEPMNYRLCIM